MNPTEHERCSELLPRYVDRTLDESEAAWVTEHLDGCPECRLELAAVRALRPPDASLSDLERARLHREVFHELGLMSGAAASARPPWGARAAQLLGAAATLALLIGGLVYLGGNLGGGDDADTGAGGGGQAIREADAGSDGFSQESAPEGGAGDRALSAAPPPKPTYEEDLGTVADRDLKRMGRRSEPFTGFPSNVEARAVGDYRESFLDELVEQASGQIAEQLRECATDVLTQLPSAVATYAAPARYGDPPREVLVIGFAYSFTERGFLDQYQMWIYPRGSCDFPTNYIGGRIGG